MKYILIAYAILIAGNFSSRALADCWILPDPTQCTWQLDHPGDNGWPLSLMVVPDGSGPPLAQARRPDGTLFDAQISVVLKDSGGGFMVGFDPADLILESEDPRFVFCPGFNIASMPTNAQGYTFFDGPLGGGGTSEENLQIKVCWQTIYPSIPLHMNSPDITGDLKVDLSDVQLFAIDYFGSYDYRSDFEYDGVVNLSDVALLAKHMGADCPF